MPKKLRFAGTLKGRVLKAIIVERARSWIEVLEKTGLTVLSLNKALAELEKDNHISRLEDGSFWIDPDLYGEYSNYYGKVDATVRDIRPPKDLEKILEKKISWLTEWSSVHNVRFGLESKHFLLSAGALDTFSQSLIESAENNVLVINPIVAKASISDKLVQAAKQKVKIKIITRKPSDDARAEYHDHLKSAGIKIKYNQRVHASVIIVDHAIAVVSSLYFYGATRSLEAGVVTFDPPVVRQIHKFYLNLEKMRGK
ncbi:MAG: phospholipase D-like domain-containing protein [Candidatus Ranarchaeia archaeon]